MKVTVTMLDVKDGDAVLVELEKENRSLVLIIDGGEQAYYAPVVKPCLQAILRAHGKAAPDVVVCTHYDSDHIGGLLPLLHDYGAGIGQVWVLPPPPLLARYQQQLQPSPTLLQASQPALNSSISTLVESYPFWQRALAGQQVDLLLESLSQLQQLLLAVPPEKLRPVFGGCQPLPEWPELKILGPTRPYFDSLFPPDKLLEEFIREEVPAEALLTESRQQAKDWIRLSLSDPCKRLKTDETAKLTATNKASIILAIDAAEGRYLFTGDAGIESFKQLPDWQNALRNLYFLKVPHHASNNNISSELIKLMRPQYAYSSGNRYQDDEVLDCLRETQGVKIVRSTKQHHLLRLPLL